MQSSPAFPTRSFFSARVYDCIKKGIRSQEQALKRDLLLPKFTYNKVRYVDCTAISRIDYETAIAFRRRKFALRPNAAKIPETNIDLGGFWAHGLSREGALRLGDDDGA